ncbi:FMN-binding glutamate synthase family protein [Thiomicrorhabdus hydrogeniphila]
MKDLHENWIELTLSWFSITFIFLIGLIMIVLIVTFIIDRTQTSSALRHNYPVIAHFRYLLEYLGKFFRQYLFDPDQDEFPFNRAERSWVYRAAKNIPNNQSFGSTKNINSTGRIIFTNCAFPTLQKDGVNSPPVIIGKNCKNPFLAHSYFNISGMSYGALSKPAVLALSKGAKKSGCWMNTGEGGVSPYHLQGGADLVAQIGTAKYGYRDKNGNLSDEKLREVAAHEQVKMFELKLSQGAKPGKGGILPGIKVNEEIAQIRGIKQGEDSISPNRHPEIDSNEKLLEMVHHIREVTGKPVGFKFVMGNPVWFDMLCETMIAMGDEYIPDFITIDGGEGGTGSAPVGLMDDVGLSISESLPYAIDALNQFGLKENVKVIASGKLINPTMVAWALAMGADFIVSARGYLFSLGCIQSMRCHTDRCPTGITTHNKRLHSGLDPKRKSNRVASYHDNLVKEVSLIAHSCGVQEARQLSRNEIRKVQTSGLSKSYAELHPETISRSQNSAFKGIPIDEK